MYRRHNIRYSISFYHKNNDLYRCFLIFYGIFRKIRHFSAEKIAIEEKITQTSEKNGSNRRNDKMRGNAEAPPLTERRKKYRKTSKVHCSVRVSFSSAGAVGTEAEAFIAEFFAARRFFLFLRRTRIRTSNTIRIGSQTHNRTGRT